MKKFTILLSALLFATTTFAQNTLSFLPKWYSTEKDTTFKDKKLINSGFPLIYKQDKDNNLYLLAFTTFGYQLSKVDAKTGKKLWTAERNQSFGTENKVYFPKDFFFRPDGNIVLFAVKGLKFPAFVSSGKVIKCVYDAKTGKEIFNYVDEKKAGSPFVYNTGALEGQIIEKSNKKGYYFSDGIGGTKIMTWIRTVDTNFVANDTLNIKLPNVDTSKGMQLVNLSHLHQINRKFYQMSAYFGGTDTSLLRTYLTKIDYDGKKYSVKDVSKNWFHGLDYTSFSPTKNGFLVSLVADSTYGPTNGLDYKPNIVLAKIDTNGILEWRTYLFPQKKDYKKGYCTVVADNKTDGYWVVLSSEEVAEKTYLYYMNKNGRLKLLGEIKTPSDDFTFYSHLLSMLDNGDIVMNYRSHSKDVHPIFEKNGTFYFERKQFESLITKNEEITILEKNILLFPNPCTNNINMKFSEVTGFSYTLVDLLGKKVSEDKVIPTNFYTIDMENFGAGIYFLNIKTIDNQFFVKKIVKQ